jgi:sugar phosphate permease
MNENSSHHRPEGRPGRIGRFPLDPARLPFFYGWIVLGVGTVGMLMSAPGQTVGVSVFTDYLIEALDLSRSALSLAYFVGTVSSALLLSVAGRVYDRYGARAVGVASAAALSLVLVGLTLTPAVASKTTDVLPGELVAAVSFAVIAVGFFLLRFFGQGILALTSRNMVMEWFEKRRGLVNAILGVSISFGFSVTPRVLEYLIQGHGWQGAWRVLALVLAGFAVLVFLLYRDTPETHGLLPDGGVEPKKRRVHPETTAVRSFTLPEARRTYTFWVFALTLFLAGLLLTAYTFHIVSIFSDAGMSRERAVTIFIPAAIVAVAVEFAASWASDFVKLKYLGMVQLAGIVLLGIALSVLREGVPVLLAILGHGVMQGLMGLTSNVTWPRFFGREHLGAVSGFAMALTVAGTAIGPYVFSFSRDLSGSYAAAGAGCALVGFVLFLAATRAEQPQ